MRSYGDHLGSTSVTADRDGEELSRTKYHAWGTTRYQSGTVNTGYAYTGKMRVDDIYYYNARWYDPQLAASCRRIRLCHPTRALRVLAGTHMSTTIQQSTGMRTDTG